MSSVRERFEQNKVIFDAISYFSPKKFPAIIDNSEELGTKISVFCENYNFSNIVMWNVKLQGET